LLLRKIITEEEYRPKKNAILEKKAQLFRKMKKLEEEANSRFEPITEFVKGLKQATNLVSRPNRKREAQHANFSESPKWRRERDSNPRYQFTRYNGLANHI